MRTSFPSRISAAGAAIALSAFLAGGCASAPRGNGVASTPNVELPAGAKLVAYGAYPLPTFAPPREGGLLYVLDEQTGHVAMVTSYAPLSVADRMAGTDLCEMAGTKRSLDSSHRYQVYFVPGLTSMPQTAMAAGQ